MTAPLTKTRQNKIKILQEINLKVYNMAWFPKSSLDMMDFRKLKEVSRKLNELYERAKPV